MKTIEQWLNTLPWGIRELAIDYMRKSPWNRATTEEVGSRSGAVLRGFLWPVKYIDFWGAVYRECLHEERKRDKKRKKKGKSK